MKWITYILAAALLVIINQSVLLVFDFGSFAPNLLLLVTLAFIVSFNNDDFIFFAGFGGLWMEAVTGLPFGSYILGLLLVAVVTRWIIDHWGFAHKDWRHFLGAIIIGSLAFHVWLWLYSNILFSVGWGTVSFGTIVMLKTLLPVLLANLILAYPIFILVEYIAKASQYWFRGKSRL